MSSIRIQVLGAGCDVGKSCMVATLGEARVMFDCGAHPGFGDERRFPDFKSIPNLSSLSLILITHFHLDHAAALPLLTEIHKPRALVYMTEPTRELARLMMLDFARTSRVRNQHCPFSEPEIEACLAKVRLIGLDTPLVPPELPEVEVTAFYAGHALGAVMFQVTTDEHSVLYSGDYMTCADRHLGGARFAPHTRPHLFVTEATFCGVSRRTRRRAQEAELLSAVRDALAAGGRVLVPVSAFGRAQQVCAVLGAHWDSYALGDVPVYVAEGLCARANAVYARFPDWRADGGNESCARDVLRDARPFNRAQHWDVVTGGAPAILFATPGNLSTGLSRDVFRAWSTDPRNLVVVPAFSLENTLAGELHGRDAPPGSGPVRCRLINMSFSSHADASGIRRTIEALRPDSVILVHGEEGKVKAFQKELSKSLNCPILAPQNGEVLEIECPTYDEEDDQCDRMMQDGDGAVNEDEVLHAYLSGPGVCAPGFTGLGYAERKISGTRQLWSTLENSLGSDLAKVAEDEYCFMECVTVTTSEHERSVFVEWGRPAYRALARKVLKVIDDLGSAKESTEEQ